jgi:hypothetical protein
LAKRVNFSETGSDGTGATFLEIWHGDTRVEIFEFFPLPQDDRPLNIAVENGVLRRWFKSPRTEEEEKRAHLDQGFDNVNGLLLFDDKVYWLKQP